MLGEYRVCWSLIVKGVGNKREAIMKTFWTTWVEETNGGYGYQHPTFDAAQKEAERLAVSPQNLGKKVRILQCLGTVVVKNTVYEPCEADELPF